MSKCLYIDPQGMLYATNLDCDWYDIYYHECDPHDSLLGKFSTIEELEALLKKTNLRKNYIDAFTNIVNNEMQNENNYE